MSRKRFTFMQEWDSSFFNKKIGKIIVDGLSGEMESFVSDWIKEGYELVYVFSQQILDEEICKKYGGILVDSKILYECEVPLVAQNIPHLERYSGEPDVLFTLAYQSGSFSRFKCDTHFSENDFQRLYAEWVIKSLSGEMASVIFVSFKEGRPVGFVTVKKEDKHLARIGLIATDKDYRKCGIGKSLLATVFHYCRQENITFLEVATQDKNDIAKKFYEKQGMRIKEITNIYHFWL